MQQPNPRADRNLLRILARHSQWEPEQAEQLLYENNIYPDKAGWKRFLDRFLLAVGASLVLMGIIFFFAYNWADMPKFAKLGVIEVLVLAVAAWAWLKPPERFSHKMALTALSVLVGALIAVFGQIYQTGANAYDFFLGWTILITAWVLISRFPPLWFFFLVLVNTSIILFGLQVLRLWDQPYALLANVGINVLACVGFEYLALKKNVHYPSRWLPRITGLAAFVILTGLSTYAVVQFSHGKFMGGSLLSFALAMALWAATLWIYQRYIRDLFFLALVPVSVMVVGITWLVAVMGDPWELTLFLCGALVIAGTGLMVKWLMRISRQWNHETPSPETLPHD